MCQISDLQVLGSQWDTGGDPSRLDVDVRATGCQYLAFNIFRAMGDAVPLYSASGRPVSSGGLAGAQFTVTSDKAVHCGELLWIEVVCETDASCPAVRELARVVCKGFDGAETCPSAGPPLSVQPAVDMTADCVSGGTYSVTVGGTWPAGTTFNWSVGNLPPGVTTPTSQHSATFTLQHPAGSPARILIAEVEVPGCPDVQSVVLFPRADGATCPDHMDISVDGAAGPLPLPADSRTYTGLAPGDYRVRVTSPTGAAVAFEWFRDGVLQPSTPATPNELAMTALLAGTTTTIDVRAQHECCNPLLDTVVLTTTGGRGPGGTGPGGTTGPDDTTTTTPPVVVTPPAWPCLILGLLVGLAMIAGLVSLVGLAIPALSVLALTPLVTAAIAILIAGILLLLICRPSWCRLLGIVAWALKWAIVLGAALAISSLSLGAILLVLVYGMIVAGVVALLTSNGCPDPPMLSIP